MFLSFSKPEIAETAETSLNVKSKRAILKPSNYLLNRGGALLRATRIALRIVQKPTWKDVSGIRDP
jgi:hypothetical protein